VPEEGHGDPNAPDLAMQRRMATARRG
jgi:hypothetical protein